MNGFAAGCGPLDGGVVCRMIASVVLLICPFIDLLVNPGFDPHGGETKCDKEPRDAEHDRLQLANRGAVAGDGRIWTKELTAVPN